MKARPAALSLSLALALAACGKTLPSPSSLTVTIAPEEPSVQAGRMVTLAANATGFTDRTLALWEIVEDATLGIDESGLCRTPPPTGNFLACPNGILDPTPDVPPTLPKIATYYAPPTPGTYHVQVKVFQPALGGSVEKSATATITVTP